MLSGVIQYAHELLRRSVNRHEHVVDATCGNGNDTLFLSKLIGDHGQVYAFDIQEQAIENTKAKMIENNRQNVIYINDSHENISSYIPHSLKGKIGGAIFNLGYLPRSDKSIVTKSDSTIKAIEQLLTYLKKNGLIVIVIYHGHDEGKIEKEDVLNYVQQLEQKKYSVIRYGFINQINNPPFVVAIEKLKNNS